MMTRSALNFPEPTIFHFCGIFAANQANDRSRCRSLALTSFPLFGSIPFCAMSPSSTRRSSSFFRARHRSNPYQRDNVRFSPDASPFFQIFSVPTFFTYSPYFPHVSSSLFWKQSPSRAGGIATSASSASSSIPQHLPHRHHHRRSRPAPRPLFAPFAPLLRTEQQALFDMSPDYSFDDFSFDYSTAEMNGCRADFASSWSAPVGFGAPAPYHSSSGSDDSSRSNTDEPEIVTATNLGTTADSCC